MPKIWRETLITVSVFLLLVQRLPETTLQTRKVEEYYQETIVWRETIKETKMTLKSGLKDFQCRLWIRRRKAGDLLVAVASFLTKREGITL
jgi:hypothetical protein